MKLRKRVSFADYIDEPVTRHNAKTSLIDGVFFSVMVGLTMPFMGVYAIQLGASDFVVGLLVSIPAMVAMISQVPAAIIVHRYSSRLLVSLKYTMAHRLSYLVMAFLALLPQDLPGRAMLLVIVFSIAHFPATVAGVGWTTLMGELFPSQLRGRVFGERNMLVGMVSLLATAAAGPFLDRVAFPINFFLLFLVSFACLIASWAYLTRLQEGTPVPGRCQDSRWRPRTMVLLVCETLRVPEFARFTAAAFVFHLGLQLPVALFIILFVHELQLSTSWIGALSVIWGVFSVLTFKWWGRLADARGSRYALALSMLVFVPLPIFYGLVQSPWPIAFLMVIGGVAGAGFGLALFNALLDYSPAGKREDYVAVFNTLMGLAGFLMPVVGVALYHRWGFLAVFILASLIRTIGTWMLFQPACSPQGVRDFFLGFVKDQHKQHNKQA
ncbi:MFS transporter [Candidatus Acetothermia bacterium]|nr:MFS transporter [Candidatus Acetothermia bacterium]MCI2427020.1 MFS transporter [Candidatus Acetothermia bacterium]